MSDRARIELFKRAVLWLEEKAGEDAALWAFMDPERVPWEAELSEFREALRALVREAFAALKRGAA